MKTIKPIILSYNLPEETDQIYAKLVNDGFKDIIVVDNGSDKCPPAKSANLLLPKNIRAIGQARIALIYCMDYFPADYYWLTTTSAVLSDHINYAEEIQQAFQDLSEIEVGVLSPALENDIAITSQRYTLENEKKGYSICFYLELVAAIVSHKLLEICRRKGSAYFEKRLSRGWGVDHELCYEAALAQKWCVVNYSMPVKWVRNAGYVKNVGGESLESYFISAGREMNTILTQKYGKTWHRTFHATFTERVKNVKFSYDVSALSNISSTTMRAGNLLQLPRIKRKIREAVHLLPRGFKYARRRYQSLGFQHKNPYEKAVRWLKDNCIKNEGIPISSQRKISYPEVTGYIIPTLYQWGEKELARDLTVWLMKEQDEDGSFSAPDGTPYTFDTGQAIRGFVAALDDLPDVEKPLRKACDWILTQVQPDGRLATLSTEMWGDIADDRIHLYVLPPLIEAGKKLNEQKYIDAAHSVLEYYKQKKDLTEFNTLSHFYAYIIEALCDLGEIDLAKKAMEHVAALQKNNGSVPAYKNVSWTCSPGLAQFAVIWYKLGMTEYADKAVHYLEKVQNRSGGFYGSYGRGANYFPEEEISWAVKFFLDAHYWKIKTAFNLEVYIFPESIDENDGRVQEILSFFGNLNGKRVIDVGCGKGRFLRVLKSKFQNAQLYGLDISEEMLDFCPDGIETKCGSILDIRYPDAHFDCVYCVEALEHALRTENAVKEMVRILKPGGKIIIIDKDIAKLGSLKLEPWEQWFKPEEVIELLQKYGVEAHYKPIAYGEHKQPDGLFIAWEGVKNA